MEKSILSNLVKELRRQNFTIYFDGTVDWVLLNNEEWYNLYENESCDMIYIYDECDNLLFYGKDINEIMDFLRKVGV